MALWDRDQAPAGSKGVTFGLLHRPSKGARKLEWCVDSIGQVVWIEEKTPCLDFKKDIVISVGCGGAGQVIVKFKEFCFPPGVVEKTIDTTMLVCCPKNNDPPMCPPDQSPTEPVISGEGSMEWVRHQAPESTKGVSVLRQTFQKGGDCVGQILRFYFDSIGQLDKIENPGKPTKDLTAVTAIECITDGFLITVTTFCFVVHPAISSPWSEYRNCGCKPEDIAEDIPPGGVSENPDAVDEIDEWLERRNSAAQNSAQLSLGMPKTLVE